VIIFVDEYEKVFRSDGDYDGSTGILTLMDGALSSEYRRLFLFTTNTLSVNSNLLQRPGVWFKSDGTQSEISTQYEITKLDCVLIEYDIANPNRAKIDAIVKEFNLDTYTTKGIVIRDGLILKQAINYPKVLKKILKTKFKVIDNETVKFKNIFDLVRFKLMYMIDFDGGVESNITIHPLKGIVKVETIENDHDIYAFNKFVELSNSVSGFNKYLHGWNCKIELSASKLHSAAKFKKLLNFTKNLDN